jgi:hypothetical protein
VQKNHDYGNLEDAYKEANIELIDFEDVLESEEDDFLQLFKRKR